MPPRTLIRRTVWRMLVLFAVGIAALIWVWLYPDVGFGLVMSLPAIIAWLAFVWPTEWRYHNHRGYLVRANRFDGAIEVFTQFGWALIEQPSDAAMTGHMPATFND